MANCLDCSADVSECSDCAAVHYWSDGSQKCELCTQPNCASCTGPSKAECTACVGGVTFEDALDNCCDMEFCVDCGNNDVSICTECDDGYDGDGTDTCSVSLCTQPNCDTCSGPSIEDCLTCDSGKFFDSGNYCCDMTNCQDCSTLVSVCSTCVVGYYWTGSLCESCQPNCATCTGPSKMECTACVGGFEYEDTLDNCCDMQFCDDCGNDLSICTTCSAGFVGDGTTECSFPSCTQPNCASCSGSAIADCLTCDPGKFFDSNNYCCDMANCQDCSAAVSACAQCNVGYYWTGSSCDFCPPPNCAACTGPTNAECTACVGGSEYADTLDNCCAMTNCDDCSSSVGICTTCSDGYEGDGTSQCSLIPPLCTQPNCATCSGPTEIEDCLTCDPGKYFDTSANTHYCCDMQYCVDCSANVAECATCETGRYWSGSLSLCEECPQPNCEFCTESECTACIGGAAYQDSLMDNCCDMMHCDDCGNDVSLCSSCMAGYYASGDGTRCRLCPQENCASCNGNFNRDCVSCVTGTYFDAKNHCCEMDFCDDCSSDRSVCVECSDGYFGDGTSICSSCSSSAQKQYCVECEEADTCSQCADGYYLMDGKNCVDDCGESYFEEDGICIECQMNNCLRCEDSKTCLECEEGYNINAVGKCKKKTDSSPSPSKNNSGATATAIVLPIVLVFVVVLLIAVVVVLLWYFKFRKQKQQPSSAEKELETVEVTVDGEEKSDTKELIQSSETPTDDAAPKKDESKIPKGAVSCSIQKGDEKKVSNTYVLITHDSIRIGEEEKSYPLRDVEDLKKTEQSVTVVFDEGSPLKLELFEAAKVNEVISSLTKMLNELSTEEESDSSEEASEAEAEQQKEEPSVKVEIPKGAHACQDGYVTISDGYLILGPTKKKKIDLADVINLNKIGSDSVSIETDEHGTIELKKLEKAEGFTKELVKALGELSSESSGEGSTEEESSDE